MLGLIKKDFLLIKSNLKSITLILILYIIMSIQGSLVLTYIIPFLGVILLTSTFSYDDFNSNNYDFLIGKFNDFIYDRFNNENIIFSYD